MSSNILFVFEGEKTETLISRSLEKHLFKKNLAIKCAFCAEIYQLYKSISQDEDLDVFPLLKERNLKTLGGYKRSEFAEIYLFFDYEGHSSLADDDRLAEALTFFDNETENGKLYISYPMVEALWHIKDHTSFRELSVRCKGKNCPYIRDCDREQECLNDLHYKTLVPTQCMPKLCNINQYSEETWKFLLYAHLSKMQYLVNDKYEYPLSPISQSLIFNKQLEKHIQKCCPKLSVLSAFPVFVYDYYGPEKTKDLIQSIP